MIAREENGCSKKVTDIVRENNRLSWELMSRINWRDYPAWDIECSKAMLEFYSNNDDFIPDEIYSEKESFFYYINYFFVFFVSSILWCAYSFFHCFGVLNPSGAGLRRFAAIYPEWSTRTRHILGLVEKDVQEFDGVIVVGRSFSSKMKVSRIMRLKKSEDGASLVPVFFPLSPLSFVKTLFSLKSVFYFGHHSLAKVNCPLPLKSQIGIVFRVFLGEMSKRWWLDFCEIDNCSVYFGHTGTADTTLLEYAIMKKGGRSVHFVHGQCSGPNFAGCSSLAVFKSQHDCDLYNWLGCYDACIVNKAEIPKMVRGDHDILLLSNLAHPMNPGYVRGGITDEIKFLQFASEVFTALNINFRSLLWKPHPVLEKIPKNEQVKLRAAASALGFNEVASDADIAKIAYECKWVISTPSTVAIDLLCEGVMPIVLDPQGSCSVGSLSLFPIPEHDLSKVCKFLEYFNDGSRYERLYRDTFYSLGPSKSISLDDCFFDH